MLSSVRSSQLVLVCQRYRNMEPKEVGVASENVYSISDIEAQMAAEDAMKKKRV